eukprot:gnl/TRDRNA2_/TRDRNA2_160196_c0_seq2.p1 gnl/TRDRNA2_/TRDRNA2_160196_c0~~gnl/TRDRNA2_/TRDRNA2_160196_c0_seq2.p1  ORF type:complete len:253 (-),score=36.51 gnl/TRDRNA2_/TRDRNA2_160196_c0_seq2:9-767(-)
MTGMATQRMSRSWPSLSHVGRQRCVLTAIADFSQQSLEKRSITDLISLSDLSTEERHQCLHDTLKVGLARCAMRLSEMPFGFCNVPSIRRVTQSYVENFRQIVDHEHRHGVRCVGNEEYHTIVKDIFQEHRGTMLDVAQGVFEFREDLSHLFGSDVDLAEVREDLETIKDIEACLDEFFTNRKLQSPPRRGSPEFSSTSTEEMVGIVNAGCQPIGILSKAYVAARFMCLRDFKVAPELLVNGLPHAEIFSLA